MSNHCVGLLQLIFYVNYTSVKIRKLKLLITLSFEWSELAKSYSLLLKSRLEWYLLKTVFTDNISVFKKKKCMCWSHETQLACGLWMVIHLVMRLFSAQEQKAKGIFYSRSSFEIHVFIV